MGRDPYVLHENTCSSYERDIQQGPPTIVDPTGDDMRRLVLAAAAATLLPLAACGSSGDSSAAGSSDGPTKITVGAIPIVDVAPLYLAEQQGFFDEQKLNVEIKNTTGGAAAVPGVVSGDYDFAFGNVVSLVLASSQGLPLKAIAEGNSST